MAKVSVSVREYNSVSRPKAKWVVRVKVPGKAPQRRFFETKGKAQAEARSRKVELRKLGERASKLDEQTLLEVLSVKEKLAPFGVSLSEVVADYVRRRGSATTSVDDVADLFLASREKLQRSGKHLDSLRRLFNRFGTTFGKHRLGDLTSDQVDGWLHGLGVGPVTINTYRTILNSLFEFGVRKKLCSENPVKAVERVTVKTGEVGILTPQQLSKLLSESDGDVRATIAIGAFAGIRPEEIARLTWEEVNLDQGKITINAAKSKTAQNRYVEILPCLAAWLRPLVGSGSIQGENFRRRYDETRRLAGFALRGNRRCRRHDEGKVSVPWPHDALRHSFASYHLARFHNAAALALELGHQSTALIFSNYRRRVSETEAHAYFEVLP